MNKKIKKIKIYLQSVTNTKVWEALLLAEENIADLFVCLKLITWDILLKNVNGLGSKINFMLFLNFK